MGGGGCVCSDATKNYKNEEEKNKIEGVACVEIARLKGLRKNMVAYIPGIT